MGRSTPLIGVLLLASAAVTHAQDDPISLHPKNPHYFQFRGKPTILIGSTEHYGAVLNGAFDHRSYLNELQERGFNLTRTFSGTYREVPGSFKIPANTLAPKPDQYIAPWPRSETPGAADGGNKFDLSRFDSDYLERLERFLAEADERGIIVEFTLFCPFYEESLWAINPMNAKNNINRIGNIPRNEAYTGKHQDLQKIQEAFVRRVVEEVNGFNNVYFEICNEPYFGGVTLDWQRRIAKVIVETEKNLDNQHMIAQNIANKKAKIEHPDPSVSLFNFHYAAPPETVGMNDHLKKAIGDDETGFRGTGNDPYRIEGWDFIIAGGALFDHLDYSFTVGHENGTAPVKAPTPGGGGSEFRAQLQVLQRFINGFDFVKMSPDRRVIAKVEPSSTSARALSEPGRAYAIYAHGGKKVTLTLRLPAGKYHAEWLDTKTGKVVGTRDLDAAKDPVTIVSPGYQKDIALRIRRKSS